MFAEELHHVVYIRGMTQMNLAARVARNVQALLDSTGASRKTTAMACGIAPETFQRRIISVGGKPFTVYELDMLAQYFGVEPHVLVCENLDPDVHRTDAA